VQAKTLQNLLQDHERALQELTRVPYDGPATPEVRAILIETCKSAIEQIRQDIEEGDDDD
jgi:chaperonin cofactor prefoldin